MKTDMMTAGIMDIQIISVMDTDMMIAVMTIIPNIIVTTTMKPLLMFT